MSAECVRMPSQRRWLTRLLSVSSYRVKREIEASFPDGCTGQVSVWKMDLADLSTVQAFAERFLASDLPLDVLINNAGIAGLWHETRTVDGFETTFQVNHLAHFYFTHALLPAYVASGKAVVRFH